MTAPAAGLLAAPWRRPHDSAGPTELRPRRACASLSPTRGGDPYPPARTRRDGRDRSHPSSTLDLDLPRHHVLLPGQLRRDHGRRPARAPRRSRKQPLRARDPDQDLPTGAPPIRLDHRGPHRPRLTTRPLVRALHCLDRLRPSCRTGARDQSTDSIDSIDAISTVNSSPSGRNLTRPCAIGAL